MTHQTHVALLHAYSSRNSGDGLLVDLSVDLLKEAFGDATRVSIVAADPASFPGHADVRPAPVLAEGIGGRLLGAAATILPVAMNGRLQELRRLLDSVDVIAGVGGGYLRARNCPEALKLEAGHLLQMRAAKASGKPAVYLPQSIGPTMPSQPLFAHLSGLLGSFASVFVRDDRSANFLRENANTHRAPDLAVLDFERRRVRIMERTGQAGSTVRHVAFVLRKAPGWSAEQRARYTTATSSLIALLRDSCRISFAVQSTGRGNDDLAYYRSLGITGDLMTLKDQLTLDRPDVVISVRLHGALESVLHGVPAFHLSYERKGFGAYADLGIHDWVVNAADFNAEHVAAHILAPGAIDNFWRAAHTRFDCIRAARNHVIDTLRAARRAS
jgi:polysaccharide pyruvyl transferase WcaK-like protein